MINIPQLGYKQTVSALEEKKEIHYSPCNGIIESALLQFPIGCEFLVEIIINHKTKQIFPTTRGGMALDDVSQTFHIGEPVRKQDPVEVVWKNYDSTYDHTCPVVVYIRKKEIAPVVKPVGGR